MIPATFDDCAAWFHPAAGRRGVVLVPAHGFEALCSRRTLRLLAEALARAGLAVLRFDPHGTGDSLGDELLSGRIERWIGDAGRAVDWLREHAGVEEVAMIGLRLGALIAAEAAARRGDIAMLGLMAPPLSGRVYARETSVLAGIIAPTQPAAAEPGLSVAGFPVTEATLAGLKALDWPKPRPAPRALVLAPASSTAGAKVAERLAAAGAAVETEPFAGYERMICDPTASEAPFAAIEALAAWAGAGAPPPRSAPAPVAPVAPLDGGTFVEEALTFGEGDALAGILCRPAARAGGPVVVFANAGGTPHLGWARMTVAMARQLAGAGIASLRMDLRGLGDSRAPEEAATPFYYEPAMRADIRAAVDLLAGRDYRDITVAGLCSGAHHAFHAAVDDPRVAGLVLVNLQCFVWGPGYALPLGAWMNAHPTQVAIRKQAADEALGEAARLQARLKDLTLRLAKRYARPALGAFTRLADRLWPAAPEGRATSVEAGFRALAGRGARLLLVYSENDPGLAELALHMGGGGGRALALGAGLRIIPATDHPLTPPHARAALAAMIEEAVRGRAARAA